MIMRLINTSNTSVVIPDLGVNLSGHGTFAEVSLDRFKTSKDLARVKHCLSIQQVSHSAKSDMPIWPFIDDKPSSKEESVYPISVNNQQDIQDLKNLFNQNFAQLADSINKIADSIQRNTTFQPVVQSNVESKDDSPIYIPSNLIPSNATVSAKIESTEQSTDHFNEATARLRGMKRKNVR